jgi:hypothetical protein
LIIYCFTFRSRIFHWKKRTYSRRSGPFSREGSLSCHTCGFSGLIRRTAPFSRLLRHTRICGGYIFARILTEPDCR